MKENLPKSPMYRNEIKSLPLHIFGNNRIFCKMSKKYKLKLFGFTFEILIREWKSAYTYLPEQWVFFCNVAEFYIVYAFVYLQQENEIVNIAQHYRITWWSNILITIKH